MLAKIDYAQVYILCICLYIKSTRKESRATSHIKLLSSNVLISLVLTTFPLKGPNLVPFDMASLRQKTP